MIDTVHFDLEINLNERILDANHTYSKTTINKEKTYHHWTNGPFKKGTIFHWDYHFSNEDRGSAKLSVQVPSIPKLLGRQYSFMLPNIEMAILFINAKLREYAGLSDVDVSKAIVTRIDFCVNYQVGEYVTDYIHALSSSSYPHRDKSIFYNRWRFDPDKMIEGNGITFFFRKR